MVEWSFSDLSQSDQLIIIISVIIYVLIAWVPMFITLYLVSHRSMDKQAEKAFDQKWYKWKKQYIWHELWYRTHVIAVLSMIIIFIFEADKLPIFAPFLFTIAFLLVTIALKYTSRRVENRVPSEDQKKLLYQQVAGTMRSASNNASELAFVAELHRELTDNNGALKTNEK